MKTLKVTYLRDHNDIHHFIRKKKKTKQRIKVLKILLSRVYADESTFALSRTNSVRVASIPIFNLKIFFNECM